MSDSERSTTGSLLKQFTSGLILICLFVPALASADPQIMLHSERAIQPAYATSQHLKKSSLTVGLNEQGDLAIRHSDVSLIVAYNPPTDLLSQRERAPAAARQECPTINGISLKMTLLF